MNILARKSSIIFLLSILGATNILASENINIIVTANENLSIKEVKPGEQIKDVKARHKKICEEMGGIDATDDSAVTLSPGAIDGGVCIKKLTPLDKESARSRKIIMNKYYLNEPTIALAAPEGSVPYQSQFNAPGIGEFRDLPPGTISWELAVPADGCSTGGSRYISGDFQVKPWVSCQAKIQNAVQSYMKGCWNTQCFYAYGIIHQY